MQQNRFFICLAAAMSSSYYMNSGWLPKRDLGGREEGFCSKPVIISFLYLPEIKLAMLMHIKVGKAALHVPKTGSQK